MIRPLRALRANPGQAAGLALAAAVLALVVAVPPLFLSSAGSAALALEVDRYGQQVPGLRIDLTTARVADSLHEAVREAAAPIGALGEPRLTIAASDFALSVGDARVGVSVMHRTGALSHVGADEEAEGIWLPDTLAAGLGVEAGDQLGYDREEGSEPLPVIVAGVYPDVTRQPPSDFWVGESNLVYGVGDHSPPPLVLVTREEFQDLVVQEIQLTRRSGGALQPLLASAEATWDFPLQVDGANLDAVEAAVPQVQALIDAVFNTDTDVGGRLHGAGRTFGSAPLAVGLVSPVATAARATVTALTASVLAVTATGVALAVAVVTAVAVLAARARRVEHLLRVAQGLSPARRALAAAGEAAVPVAIGSAAGLAAAWALVGWVGPGPLIGTDSVAAAARGVVMAGTVACLVVGAVAVAGVVRSSSRRSRWRAAAARVPWETLPLLLAFLALQQLLQRGEAVVVGEAGPAVDLLVVGLPVLALIGLGGLAVRGLRAALPAVRRLPQRVPTALWLASRRLAAARGGALGLVGVAVVAAGVVTYSTAAAGSTSRTVAEKVTTRTGAEVVLDVAGPSLPPAEVFDFPASFVYRSTATTLPGDVEVDTLAVDPATLSRVTDVPDEALRALTAAEGSDVPGILVVGDGLGETDGLRFDRVPVPLSVETVGALDAFPGMDLERPMVVIVGPVDLEGEGANWRPQLWARGSALVVEAAAAEEGLFVGHSTEAGEVVSAARAREVTWALGLFTALGMLAGLLAVVGLAAYVAARQREQAVFATLAARIRLRRGTQVAAVALELAALLALATLVGTAAGLALAWVTTVQLDPLPALPPGPSFVLPVWVLAGLLPAVLIAAALAAAWSQRRAHAAHPATVMRTAE